MMGCCAARTRDRRSDCPTKSVHEFFDPTGSADYHYTLGIAYQGNNESPSAKAEFGRALGLAPGLHHAYFMLGSIWANEGDLDQAVRFYRRAIKLAPRKADYYAALGRVLIQMGPGHNKEAVDWLKRALSLDPEYIPAKFYLALACEGSGDLWCAKKLLEEVTTTDPTELKPHIVLAGVYYRLKDRERGDREKAIISRLQAEEGPKPASDQPFHQELK
jgi:Tfp pilus assembly protein PilF